MIELYCELLRIVLHVLVLSPSLPPPPLPPPSSPGRPVFHSTFQHGKVAAGLGERGRRNKERKGIGRRCRDSVASWHARLKCNFKGGGGERLIDYLFGNFVTRIIRKSVPSTPSTGKYLARAFLSGRWQHWWGSGGGGKGRKEGRKAS